MIGRRGTLAAALVAAGLCALLALSATAAARAPKNFFGVVPQGPLTDQDFARMGKAKVGTLRFQLVWSMIDGTSAAGDYDWAAPDHVIGQAARNGVRALPFVYSTPDWVARLDGVNCQRCGAFAPRNGAALQAWREFLLAAVQRYGPGGQFWAAHPEIPERPIRAWQLWNEQNSPTFYAPRPKVKAYAKLLSAGHDAILSVDRGAEIVLGGMFATPLGGDKPAIKSWKYLKRLYRVKGAKRSFDGVAPHPYAPQMKNVKAQIDLLRRAMKHGHDRKAELWITEIGWSSARNGNPLNRGPRGQADRLTQAFKYFQRKRRKFKIENVDWYSWRDNHAAGVGLCAFCPDSGLLKEGYDPKRSLRAFTRFTGGS